MLNSACQPTTATFNELLPLLVTRNFWVQLLVKLLHMELLNLVVRSV